MNVRAATIQDINAIAALEQAVFGKEPYPALFFRQALDLWPQLLRVADDRHGVGGYALAAVAGEPATAWILSLGVHPSLRGKGLGTALMKGMLDAMRDSGVDCVRLTVHPENRSAISVYRQQGFKETARQSACSQADDPRLVMEHLLY